MTPTKKREKLSSIGDGNCFCLHRHNGVRRGQDVPIGDRRHTYAA